MEFCDLISEMIHPEPHKRISINSALNSIIFKTSGQRLLILCEFSDVLETKEGKSDDFDLFCKKNSFFIGKWTDKINPELVV